jgi:hypothetical protein
MIDTAFSWSYSVPGALSDAIDARPSPSCLPVAAPESNRRRHLFRRCPGGFLRYDGGFALTACAHRPGQPHRRAIRWDKLGGVVAAVLEVFAGLGPVQGSLRQRHR